MFLNIAQENVENLQTAEGTSCPVLFKVIVKLSDVCWFLDRLVPHELQELFHFGILFLESGESVVILEAISSGSFYYRSSFRSRQRCSLDLL